MTFFRYLSNFGLTLLVVSLVCASPIGVQIANWFSIGDFAEFKLGIFGLWLFCVGLLVVLFSGITRLILRKNKN